MDSETSEQLDIIPATVQVLQDVRFKYAVSAVAAANRTQIIISHFRPSRFPAASPSAATVAAVLKDDYADVMPRYRQRDLLLGDEVNVARGTLA